MKDKLAVPKCVEGFVKFLDLQYEGRGAWGTYSHFSNFSALCLGNLWLAWLGISHCSLWPVQTINFLGTRAGNRIVK